MHYCNINKKDEEHPKNVYPGTIRTIHLLNQVALMSSKASKCIGSRVLSAPVEPCSGQKDIKENVLSITSSIYLRHGTVKKL